jgi:hypothetical protein
MMKCHHKTNTPIVSPLLETVSFLLGLWTTANVQLLVIIMLWISYSYLARANFLELQFGVFINRSDVTTLDS